MLLGNRYYYCHCFGRRLNEIKHLDQGHITGKGQSSDLNPGGLIAVTTPVQPGAITFLLAWINGPTRWGRGRKKEGKYRLRVC